MITDNAVLKNNEDFFWESDDSRWIPTGPASAILYLFRGYGYVAISLHLQKHTAEVLVSPAFILPDIGGTRETIRHFLFKPNDFIPECKGDFADVLPLLRTGELLWSKSLAKDSDLVWDAINEGVELFDRAMPRIMEFVRHQCRGGVTLQPTCLFDDTDTVDIF